MYEISLCTGRYCELCGKELGYLDPTHKRYYKGSPELGNSYLSINPHSGTGEYRKRCFDCFVNEFGRLPSRQNVNSKDLDWMLQIDTHQRRKENAVTLDNLTRKYGAEEGKRRFDAYCEKQSVKNTFEFKQQKFGWTREQFEDYNTSRSVTLTNCIARHGEEVGTRIFNEYCEKQKDAGCTLSYFQSKLGEELGKIKYENVCKAKIPSLENFIKRHGEDKGTILWEDYVNNRTTTFFSAAPQSFFTELHSLIPEEDCRYGTQEFGLYDKLCGRYYKYDFVIPSRKKIIEFHGSYWHADPRRGYSETEMIGKGSDRRSVQEIRETDEKKLYCAKELGYDIFVIWEDDVKTNRKEAIEQCLKFLKY